MNSIEFDKQLSLLGITGPLSDMPPINGLIKLPYMMPNKTIILIPASDQMTISQKLEQIALLKHKIENL